MGLGLLSGSNSSSLYCSGSGAWCRAYADGGGGGGRSRPYVGVSFRTLLVAGTVEFAIGGLGVLQLDLDDADVDGDGGSLAGAKVGLGGSGEGSCHLCQSGTQ